MRESEPVFLSAEQLDEALGIRMLPDRAVHINIRAC
jgi:hypothetical protein